MSDLHVKYLLIGGGLAASSAAVAIRQLDADGSVMLIGQEVNRPYYRPALSREFLLGRKPRAELFTLEEHWLAENNVELRTGRRATRLDVHRHAVALNSGQEIAFDFLLLATGASPRHMHVPGADLPNVFYLRSLEDGDRLHNAIEQARREGRPHEQGRGRAAIIGGGLLGAELSATLTRLGLAADLIIPGSYPLQKFVGDVTGKFIGRYLAGRGVTLHTQVRPARFEGDGRVQRIILADGQSLPCDFVVPAIGIAPHKELLRGTPLLAEQAILVDDHCRTSDPSIFAAGDCAAVFDPLFGRHRVMDHWQSAACTGTLAGTNMAGGAASYSDVTHFDSELLGLKLCVWGDARSAVRRLMRGMPRGDEADLAEIGIDAEGRVAQVAAIGRTSEHAQLRELVRARATVAGREDSLRDPGVPL